MKNFILASRPKTLLAGGVPPLVAYAYYYGHTGMSQIFILSCCVLGALFIQLATNFFNDVIDHQKGADTNRVGPVRVSASGLVPVKKVNQWAIGCVMAAAICGIPLIMRGGWPFLVLGLISLFLTYGYTGGKVSLAYRGLGEIFVFLFFGLFSVMGSYYLFSLELNSQIFVIASNFGLLCTTFIGVNNLRDRNEDIKVGKKTMATRLKSETYIGLILITIFFPYATLIGLREFPLVWVTLLALIPAFKLSWIVIKKTGPELNEGLKFAGIHLVAFSVLLSLAFIHARLF